MNVLFGFLSDLLGVLFVIFLIGLLVTISVLGLRIVIQSIREENEEKGAQE